MSSTELFVLVTGAALVAWINWYFFVAVRSVAVIARGGAGPAQVIIAVDGGYSPSVIRVKAGAPVRLVFDRRATSSCSEEVVFPAFGVRRFLPTGERTTIEVTPPAPGTYDFMCGMSMLRGKLVAEG